MWSNVTLVIAIQRPEFFVMWRECQSSKNLTAPSNQLKQEFFWKNFLNSGSKLPGSFWSFFVLITRKKNIYSLPRIIRSMAWNFHLIICVSPKWFFSMNNESAPLQYTHDFTVPRLAPVFLLKPISKEIKPKRKVSKPKAEKEEKELPEFYNKPIYRSKKYDLL